MAELALVVFAFALVAMAFALGFIAGAFYIPRKSRNVLRDAIKDADLTTEQRDKLSAAIDRSARGGATP